MRSYLSLLACLLCLGGSGCSLAQTSTRNAFLGPCEWWEERQENRRYESLAAGSWQSAKSSVDSTQVGYADGYRDGFIDFLKRGGNGEPPPMEMIRYARRKSANRCAVDQWAAGFRHGSQDARASGQRWCATKTPLLCGGHGPVDPYANAYCVEGLPHPKLLAPTVDTLSEPRAIIEESSQPATPDLFPSGPSAATASPVVRARIGAVRPEQDDE
ncbi:MAG: hypothetical protein K2X38_16240 [Gemmataceae bacterium]|nr:hypothetical protein [Gemmataceae bacterium]